MEESTAKGSQNGALGFRKSMRVHVATMVAGETQGQNRYWVFHQEYILFNAFRMVSNTISKTY